MKKTSVVLAALTTITLSATANAQVCAGFPTMDGQSSVALLSNFPEGFDQYGVEGSYNMAGPLGVNAGFLLSTGDGEDLNTFRVGASFDITSLVATMMPSLSLCPVASLDYSSEDDVTLMRIPLGLGFGTSFPVGAPDLALTPYVIPQFVFFRLSSGGESLTEDEFGLRGGADLSFGRFYFGAHADKIFADQSDAVFGVKAGVKF